MLDSGDLNIGYNAETGVYEDLLKAGIIDPAKVGAHTGSRAHARIVRGFLFERARPVSSRVHL